MKLVKRENSKVINQSERDKTISALMAETGIEFEVANSIVDFADSTTRQNLKRKLDIRRDKIFACRSFFSTFNKEPDKVTVADVNEWHQWMLDEGNQKTAEGLEESTIYTRLSHLSAYFEWLRKLPEFAHFIKSNPVRLAMPKPPKKYNSSKAKALTDEELSMLWIYLEDLAKDDKNKIAMRDFAIFMLFMATGMRREEIIDLGAGDIKITDSVLLIHALVKGGDYEWKEVSDGEVIDALERYLLITKRKSSIGNKKKALWIRLDRGAEIAEINNKEKDPNNAEIRLTSDGFEKQIKKYAHEAGIGHIHIHQFRHTFARIVAEEKGLIETQDALGHANIETTRQYVKKIEFKKDKHSHRISNRIKPFKVTSEIDKFAEENNWNDETIEAFAKEHLRTKYE